METHRRTLAKTVSWRFIAMLVTACVAWGFTGKPAAGLAIGVADTLVKFIVYYLHERAWTSVRLGYKSHEFVETRGEGI